MDNKQSKAMSRVKKVAQPKKGPRTSGMTPSFADKVNSKLGPLKAKLKKSK